MCMTTKRDVYARWGVEFDGTYITAPVFGRIRPLLKVGNSKVGKRVRTFSLLAGDKYYTLTFVGVDMTQRGTCRGTCKCKLGDGRECITCYGFYGRCAMSAALRVAFMNTVFMRFHLDWLERALCAQIEAEHLSQVRIHATGDFETDAYAQMWARIVARFPDVKFWTYTKETDKESLFDELPNGNIVKSVLPTGGYNYGKCGYVMAQYEQLRRDGVDVGICACGTPHEKHCQDCRTCQTHEVVLFLQHSTPDYNAKKDALYGQYCEFVRKETEKED